MASAGEDGTGVLIEISEDCETNEVEVFDEKLVLPPLPLDLNDSTASCENIRADSTSTVVAKEELCSIDAFISSDIKNLDEEVFDFDLALSPEVSQEEDEDEEVFFGPVGFTEACVSVAVDIAKSPEYKPLSPLNPEQVAELCKEANILACRISALSVSDKKKKAFPKVSLKDSIRKSAKNSRNVGKSDNRDEFGLPRVKLDFGSPKSKVELGLKDSTVALPVGELPTSPEGVKLFSAKKNVEKTKDERSCRSKPSSKLCPPNSRKSGLQKPKTGTTGAPTFRAPKKYSPLKRQRTSSLGSDIDTCSTASDVSSASSISSGFPTNNKRSLPSPKFQPSSRGTKKQGPSNLSKSKPNTGAIQSSLAKSSLLKPSTLPNKTAMPSKTVTGRTKPSATDAKKGPMKATVPIKGQTSIKNSRTSGIGTSYGKENKPAIINRPAEKAPRKSSGGSTSSLGSTSSPNKSSSSTHNAVPTPHRKDKQIKPKCLLPNSCSPVKAKKSSSASSVPATPCSNSASHRRSFLPTPKCTPKSGPLTSSKHSPKTSFTPSRTNGKMKNGAPVIKLIDIDTPDYQKKPLVMNTPQAEKMAKKPSLWSPIARRKPSGGDEFIMCTKRTSQS